MHWGKHREVDNFSHAGAQLCWIGRGQSGAMGPALVAAENDVRALALQAHPSTATVHVLHVLAYTRTPNWLREHVCATEHRIDNYRRR
eukprot:8957614-Pyramimonas_sp.AAC.1